MAAPQWLVILSALAGLVTAQPECGALCDYVHREDPNYGFSVLATYPGEGVTTYILNFTSQQWFDADFSSRPVWWHHLAVNIPDTLVYPDRAFFYLSWYSNNDNPPDSGSRHVRETASYAANTGMVTAVIRQVPNQPVIMRDTILPRTEDSIIAWTWMEFMEDEDEVPDPEVLLRFPMCKAAKRAMDAITEFAAETAAGSDIEKFMVAGESKRGWTTWLMGAVDERVEVIAPVVLSCLNLNENMHHYYQSFGNWPFAFGSYYVENVTSYLDHPRVFELERYVDPYRYRDWLTMPKLMVSGASDEFFMPDDYEYFFDDLIGEKFMWLLENTGHDIAGSPLNAEYWEMLESFYISVIEGESFPEFSWEKEFDETGGSVTLITDEDILEISVLMADTPEMVVPRRDFRNYVLEGISTVPSGIEWDPYEVEDLGDGRYRARFDDPPEGHYRAFYIKVTFPYEAERRTLTFTSEAQIIPSGFPFDDCYGPACRGNLV